MKRNTSKYSSKALKDAKVKRDASRRRTHSLGPAAIVTDMDDIANYTAHQAVIADQLDGPDNDCLWA